MVLKKIKSALSINDMLKKLMVVSNYIEIRKENLLEELPD